MSGFGTLLSESVDVITLDACAASIGVERLDCIKFDVEGHEPSVFRGAVGLLQATRPVVLFEVSGAALGRGGATRFAACEELRTLGYEFFVIVQGRLAVCGGRKGSKRSGGTFGIEVVQAFGDCRRGVSC